MVYIENFLTKPKGNLLLGSVKDVIKFRGDLDRKKHSSKIKQTVAIRLEFCNVSFVVEMKTL